MSAQCDVSRLVALPSSWVGQMCVCVCVCDGRRRSPEPACQAQSRPRQPDGTCRCAGGTSWGGITRGTVYRGPAKPVRLYNFRRGSETYDCI